MDWTTPFGAPFYPLLPAVYRNVVLHMVRFVARPDALKPLLPAPLEPDADAVCVAAGLDIPYSSNYGAFQEAFLMLGCVFRGTPGYYCSHVFHNGPVGIAAGREIYGTPKVFAEVKVRRQDGGMWTEARMGSEPVIRVETECREPINAAALPALEPSWRLKWIPRADGPGPAIKQLIDGSKAGRNMVIHRAVRGTGSVAYAALEPLTCIDAFEFEASYEEHYAEITYDYLASSEARPGPAGPPPVEGTRGVSSPPGSVVRAGSLEETG